MIFSRMNPGVEVVSRLVRGNTHSPAGSRKGERSELGVATEHGAGKWRLWSIDTSVGGWFPPFLRQNAARFVWETKRWCWGWSAAMRPVTKTLRFRLVRFILPGLYF